MPDKKDAKEKKQRKRSVRQKQKQQQNVIINVGEVKRRRAPARKRKAKASDAEPVAESGFRSFNMPAPQITYNFPASSNFGSEPAKATTVPIYDKKPTFANTMNPISLYERDPQTAPLGDIHHGDAPVQKWFNPSKHTQTDMQLFEGKDTHPHVENAININREDNLVEGLGASMMGQPDVHRDWVQPTSETSLEVFGEPESTSEPESSTAAAAKREPTTPKEYTLENIPEVSSELLARFNRAREYSGSRSTAGLDYYNERLRWIQNSGRSGKPRKITKNVNREFVEHFEKEMKKARDSESMPPLAPKKKGAASFEPGARIRIPRPVNESDSEMDQSATPLYAAFAQSK